RQVIPASDAQYRPQPQRAGTEVMIELWRSQIDERRDEDEIGRLLAKERVELAAARDRLLELSQHPGEHTTAARGPQERRAGPPAAGYAPGIALSAAVPRRTADPGSAHSRRPAAACAPARTMRPTPVQASSRS